MPNNPTNIDFMPLDTLITSSMVQYRCWSVTGVVLSVETIKKIRRGDRSQNTPTGKLVINTVKDIKNFLSNSNN